MATVTPEQLASIEWAADVIDVFDCATKGCPACGSKQRDGHRPDCWLAAALSSPPAQVAAPPAGVLDGPRPTTALDREYAKALDVINQQREELDRLRAAPPADLVALVKRVMNAYTRELEARNAWVRSAPQSRESFELFEAVQAREADTRAAFLALHAFPLPEVPDGR